MSGSLTGLFLSFYVPASGATGMCVFARSDIASFVLRCENVTLGGVGIRGQTVAVKMGKALAMRNVASILIGGTILLCCGGAAAADTSVRTIDSVLACRAIASADDRIRCFDRAAADLAEAQRSGDLIALDRQKVGEAKKQGFGLPTARRATVADPLGTLEQIEAKIVAVAPSGYDRLRISVDNNGVWESLEPISMAPDVGKTIRIVRTGFGGFRGSVGKGRSFLVKRVR